MVLKVAAGGPAVKLPPISGARHAARTPPLVSSSCATARRRLVALKRRPGQHLKATGTAHGEPHAGQRRPACSEDSPSGVLKLRHGAWKAGGAEWGMLPLSAPGPSEAELALPDWQGAFTLTGRTLQPSAQKRPEEAPLHWAIEPNKGLHRRACTAHATNL